MSKAFSLIETMFAVSILALVISASMGTWILFLHKSDRVNTQASLDMDIRMVTERFRYDLRKTGRETILFYPPEQQPHQAVGFGLTGLDVDGRVEMDAAGGSIRWRQTVIYHVWNPSSDEMEMRRTVFSNRNPEATDNERLNQLAGVVSAGDGGGACLGGETAQTTVLFKNLFTGKLWHSVAEFDAYAPPPGLREKVTFGSVMLGPGTHAVNFTVAGKNDVSSGYALRLDQVAASVSAWPLEAELRETEGANAAMYFVGQGLAGGAYGLSAATAGIGDTLSVKVLNDAVEECEFIGSPRCVSFSNTVVRFDEQFQPGGFEEGVNTAKLDGQFTNAWWASAQADALAYTAKGIEFTDESAEYYRFTNTCVVVRVPVSNNYVQANGYGPVFRMYKTGVDNRAQILNPSFAPSDWGSPDVATNLTQLSFYQSGVKKSTWSSCARGVVEVRPDRLSPIYMGQSFIFSYAVSNTAASSLPPNNVASVRAYRLKEGLSWCCWVIEDVSPALAQEKLWSTGTSPLIPALIKDGTANKKCLPGLVALVVNYAEEGEYVSHPYDTANTTGAAKSFEWGEPSMPSGVGASVKLYARGGDALTEDGFGIADAPAWENVAEAGNGGGFSGNSGRYVQFRAVFTSQKASLAPKLGGLGVAGPYRSDTPKLQWARFTWDGEEKFVDVTADLLKSPDGGKFEVNVDGKPLVRGVTMELEVYKDVRTGGAAKERLRSAMTVEVEPRNSGR